MSIPVYLLPHAITLKCDKGEDASGVRTWQSYSLTRARCETQQQQSNNQTAGTEERGAIRVWIDKKLTRAGTVAHTDPAEWEALSNKATAYTLRNGDRITWRSVDWTITSVADCLDRYGRTHHFEVDATRVT